MLTHHPPATPPKQDERLTFTFVRGDITSAIEQAKAAAGDKAVQAVGGPSVIHDLLHAGLVDELHVDVMPVVLGRGLLILDQLDPSRVVLQKMSVVEVGPRTSLRYRVTTRS